MSYIYTENGDINFRYQLTGKETNYISISNLHDQCINGFKSYNTYWGNVNTSFTDVNNIYINGIGNTVGGQYTNLPLDTDGWGTLINFVCDVTIIQYYFGWNSGHLWYRMHYNNYAWVDWCDITSISNRLDNLENKFNNLFSQSGTTLNITY